MEDLNYAVKISRLILSIVGGWPDNMESKCLSHLLLIITLLTNVIFNIFAQTNKLLKSNGNLDVIAEVLCIADISIPLAMMKLLTLRLKSKDLNLLLQDMLKDFVTERTSQKNMVKMHESARAGRRLSQTCMLLALIACNIYFVLRLLILRQRLSVTGKRDWVFEADFALSIVQVSPWFETVWLLQVIGGFFAGGAYAGFDSFFGVLVWHLCGQMEVLKIDLNMVTNQPRVLQRIAKIAKKHDQLNRRISKLENIFNNILLVQIVGNVVQLSLQGYQISRYLNDKSVDLPYLHLTGMAIYIIYTTFDLYIFCYVVDKLREKSLELSFAAYNCKWYNLNSNEVYDLIFIMKRAQNPLTITAGKFVPLSVKLFADIAKASFGYLSVLLAMKEREY